MNATLLSSVFFGAPVTLLVLGFLLTRVGINSQTFARLYRQPSAASSMLISLGANDPPGTATVQILAAVRLAGIVVDEPPSRMP